MALMARGEDFWAAKSGLRTHYDRFKSFVAFNDIDNILIDIDIIYCFNDCSCASCRFITLIPATTYDTMLEAKTGMELPCNAVVKVAHCPGDDTIHTNKKAKHMKSQNKITSVALAVLILNTQAHAADANAAYAPAAATAPAAAKDTVAAHIQQVVVTGVTSGG